MGPGEDIMVIIDKYHHYAIKEKGEGGRARLEAAPEMVDSVWRRRTIESSNPI
jgi:hypothetical protein